MSDSLSLKKEFLPHLDILSLAAALCIATVPWGLKLNTLTIIVFGVGLLSYTFYKKGRLEIKTLEFLSGSMIFLVAMVWLLITSNQADGLKYLERSSSALIFPLLFSIIYNQYRLNIHYILCLFMLSCLLRYFIFIYDVIEFELIFIFDYWQELLIQFNQLFKLHALHPSYFSMFLGFNAMICYYYFIKSEKVLMKALWILGIFVFLIFNISLGAKMPLLASLVTLALGIFIHLARKSNKIGLIKIGGGLLLSAALIGLFLKKTPNSISQDLHNYYQVLNGEEIDDLYDYNQYGTNSNLDTWKKTNRIYIWREAIGIIKDNYLIGVGTGDMTLELNKRFKANNNEYLATKNTNSHNQIFDYLIKYGIIGFSLIVIAFVMYYRKAWSLDHLLYMMFLVLTGLCMLTENILNRQLGIVFFFFLNSLFYYARPGRVVLSREIE